MLFNFGCSLFKFYIINNLFNQCNLISIESTNKKNWKFPENIEFRILKQQCYLNFNCGFIKQKVPKFLKE